MRNILTYSTELGSKWFSFSQTQNMFVTDLAVLLNEGDDPFDVIQVQCSWTLIQVNVDVLDAVAKLDHLFGDFNGGLNVNNFVYMDSLIIIEC